MPAPEGKFRQQRHPLCPGCKYDLVATVQANRRVCPECGYEFEMYELSGEKRPGDWTFGIGLRRAFIFLLVRSLLILPVWVAIVCLVMPLLSMFPVSIGAFAGIAIILALPGCMIGYLLGSKLSEYAGFQSMLLGIVAGFFALGVILGGVILAQFLKPMSGWQGSFMAISTTLFAIAWIIRATMLDD
jgi:hypothetical protein